MPVLAADVTDTAAVEAVVEAVVRSAGRSAPPAPVACRGGRPHLFRRRPGGAAAQPAGRLATADEVASAIAFLASPRSGATTGTALTVDGGLTGLRLPSRS
ncbi:SDR family oxidoreductase [Blastococcus sp. SYSU DS0510]